MDEGRGQGAGQEASLAGVGDRLDSMTQDNSIDPLCRFRSRGDGDGDGDRKRLE